MYLWKDNTENNVRNIRKEVLKRELPHKELLHTEPVPQRNLLGVQKSSTFTEDFCLSELMSVEMVKLKAKVNFDFCYLLSPPKITELMLLASVCYFIMATERRFSEGHLEDRRVGGRT